MFRLAMKSLSVFLLALFLGIFAASALLAQSGGDIRIGAIVTSSGPFAEWGRANTVALRMLEEEVNASGGVNGAKIHIIIVDDAGKPAQAANAVRKLAGDDQVLAIAGPLTSSTCEVAFPVANEMKVTITSNASSKPGVAANNRPWAFRNTIDEALFGKVSVPYFKKTYNVKSVGIIYDAKDAVSTAIATKIFPALMRDNAINIVNADKPLSFNTGDLDVSAQVTALRVLNPGGVVIAADASQAVTVLREMRRQGLIVPVIGGSPLISSAILLAAPEIPIIAPATFYASMDRPAAKAFAAKLLPRLRATSGLPRFVEPNMYDANIYEIVKIYLDAIRAENIRPSDDIEQAREKIRDYVTALKNFQGLGGPISFLPSGDASKIFFIVQGQKGAWETKQTECSAAGGCGS